MNAEPVVNKGAANDFDRSRLLMTAAVLALSIFATVWAEVAVTSSHANWVSLVAAPTVKLGFNDLETRPYPIPFADQYAQFGVHATQGDDLVLFGAFPDQWGLFGRFPTGPGDPSITLEFDALIHGIGFRANSGLIIDLFAGDDLVVEDLVLGPFFQPEKFWGVVASTAFDRAKIRSSSSPFDAAVIDDLHIEMIPAPSMLALIAVGVLRAHRRRRAL